MNTDTIMAIVFVLLAIALGLVGYGIIRAGAESERKAEQLRKEYQKRNSIKGNGI